MGDIFKSIELCKVNKDDAMPEKVIIDFTHDSVYIDRTVFENLVEDDKLCYYYGVRKAELRDGGNAIELEISRESDNEIYLNVTNNGEDVRLKLINLIMLLDLDAKQQYGDEHSTNFIIPAYDNLSRFIIQADLEKWYQGTKNIVLDICMGKNEYEQ